jgi:hypothetical protein
MKSVLFTKTAAPEWLLAFWREIDDKTWGRGFDCFMENAIANLGVSDWHGREAIRENLRAFVDKGSPRARIRASHRRDARLGGATDGGDSFPLTNGGHLARVLRDAAVAKHCTRGPIGTAIMSCSDRSAQRIPASYPAASTSTKLSSAITSSQVSG